MICNVSIDLEEVRTYALNDVLCSCLVKIIRAWRCVLAAISVYVHICNSHHWVFLSQYFLHGDPRQKMHLFITIKIRGAEVRLSDTN